MPPTTNTQESTDPIARLESDMLRFTPSRGWEIKVVTFPATPNNDVVVTHGLTVDAPEAIQYQVLQTNCPQIVYHNPTSLWTRSEIRLRSTAESGQAVILLTTGKTTPPRLDLWQGESIRIGSNRYGWTFTDTSAAIAADRTNYSISTDTGASSASMTLGGSQVKGTFKSGSITLGFAPTNTGAVLYGSAGLTFGTNASSVLYNRFFAHQLSLNTITASISADQNDYSPTGWPTASVLLLGITGANRTLTGLDATAAYINWNKTGRVVYVQNNSATYTLTLSHANISSSADNRFNLPYGEDVVLGPGEGVDLIFNGTNWSLFTKAHSFASAIKPKAGIQFPAVQVASSDVNTLDDYEEGSWTPVIGGSGGTSGQTYADQTGRYIKIGKFVIAWYSVSLTDKGTITGGVQIQGLPLTVQNIFSMADFPVQWDSLATSWVKVGSRASINSTAITLSGATAAATSSATGLTTADIQNNSNFSGCVQYQAAN